MCVLGGKSYHTCVRVSEGLGVMNDCKPNEKSLQEISVPLFS